MIGIIDYGAGNLLSVKKALEYFQVECKIIASGANFTGIEKLILPGVGAFHSAIHKLKTTGLYSHLLEWLISDKPFLGICLGMQLLFEESEEGNTEGFKIFKGKVNRFRNNKVPQIGWNQVHIIKRKSNLILGIKDKSFFYFLHGYFVATDDESIIVGKTDYGIFYPSVIEKGNIYGVQFHPEKSGVVGLKLIQNWLSLC